MQPASENIEGRGQRRCKWGCLVAFLFGIVVGYVGRIVEYYYFSSPPPIPASWVNVRAGLTREHVIELVGEDPIDMRNTKGIDFYNHWCNAEETWTLELFYSEDLVSKVWFRFINHPGNRRNRVWTDPDEETRSMLAKK